VKFSQAAQIENLELVISRAHDKWIVEDGEFNDLAKAFLTRQMNTKPRVREGTVSASSLGGCIRSQQFTYIGVKKLKIEPRGAAIFKNGDFMHLRWQMSGLSAGWLLDAEVPVPKNTHNLAGTMDGTAYTDDVVEFKSINDNGFKGVTTFGPQKKHLLQGASYLLASERERVIFVYENKNNQEYREYVRTRAELPMEEAEVRAENIHTANALQQLEEPLKPCERREGFDYNYCPFRHICLETKDWDDAVRQARGE
jgi:hypothetical protein